MKKDGRAILFRIPYPDFFSQHAGIGGHVAHALGLVEGFLEAGNRVVVLAHEGRREFETLGAAFITVVGSGKGVIGRQLWLRRFFALSRQLLREGAFDLTYTRYSASAVPHLIRDFVTLSVPSVLEINSLGSQRLSLLRWLDRRVLQRSTLSVAVSGTLKTWIADNLGERGGVNIHIVPNAVGSSRFRTVPREFVNGSTFRCASAGLLKPDYGLECLVEAARRSQDDHEWPIAFHVFGAGPFAFDLRRHARDVENVHFEGEVPFAEMPDRLAAMDCLVYTTAAKNAFQSPTKLFEYMAIGRPIVAARTPQTEEILRGGELGTLFELESGGDLAQAVRSVRDNYFAALDRAARAQEVARREHSWRSRAETILQALEV